MMPEVSFIFGAALKLAAHHLILSHNYPSGNLHPSIQDKGLTAKIKEACKYMEINLPDHIILSAIDGESLSHADNGLI